jgi:phospholipase C
MLIVNVPWTNDTVLVTETDSNQEYAICGVIKGDNETGQESIYADNAIRFNAATNTIICTNFSGNASTANYADLAEKYSSDDDYQPGTVVMFGGEKEVTASVGTATTKVAGVVSTDPAYLMNAEAQGVAVALKGRVPCFVVGPVSKGDLLVTSHVPGVAQVSDTWIGGAVIGKAIEDCPIDGEVRIIEIAIGSI